MHPPCEGQRVRVGAVEVEALTEFGPGAPHNKRHSNRRGLKSKLFDSGRGSVWRHRNVEFGPVRMVLIFGSNPNLSACPLLTAHRQRVSVLLRRQDIQI